eukprot:CAMPEP_0201285840 /NCGR_PEP_ID=MMETSP1317-20130820/113895_1 /ASSEMBLY_ACC=CAM_ASM_000770 /TAXON_ID=187299 /ORGANISM="Undescribed Undescribed, Strain Undescribed" /LENGTH=132 /DNA_ID=CAMNT_0047611879 /DNA_START=1134 /DNA_END=1532 /DNA_ORIENTATION=-
MDKVLLNTEKKTYTYSKVDLEKWKELMNMDGESDEDKFQLVQFYLQHDYISPNHLCYIFNMGDAKVVSDWVAKTRKNELFGKDSPYYERCRTINDQYDNTKSVKVPTPETLLKVLQKKHGESVTLLTVVDIL